MKPASTARGWILARRSTQLAALAATLALFAFTRTGAEFVPPRAVEWLFLLDPLVALAALVAGSLVGALVLAGLLSLLAPLLVGRAFCGWLCPLGTLLDIVRRVTRPLTRGLHARTNAAGNSAVSRLARLRYGVLLVTVIGLLLGLPMLGIVQPFAILVRGLTAMTQGVPALLESDAGFTTEQGRPAPNRPLSETGIRFMRAPVPPLEARAPEHAWTSLLLLAVVLLLDLVQPRAWCRNICPTGALLGLMARWSLVRRVPRGTCAGCTACVPACLAGAFDAENRLHPSACTLCMSCRVVCPPDIIRFRRQRLRPDETVVDWSRRGFLISSLTGLAAPLVLGSPGRGLRSQAAPPDPLRLRPPGAGALGEDRFLSACVRCGECVKVCPTHGLQHAGLEDGFGAWFAPRLVPRIGPCEYDCRACAEVCPTGAIPLTDLVQKRQTRIGVAIHDHQRCLPWSMGGECRVCRERCPAPGKAIQLKLGRAADGGAVMLPFVDPDRCIGCGTCEFVCPVQGVSGIRVVTLELAEALRPILQPPRPGVGWT